MAAIMFGSFQCRLPVTCSSEKQHVIQQQGPPCADYKAPMKRNLLREGEELVQAYDQQIEACFAKLSGKPMSKFATPVVNKRGLATMKEPKFAKLKRLLLEEKRRMEEEKAFFLAPPSVITSISIGGGITPSIVEETKRGVIHTTPSQKKVMRRRNIHMSSEKIENLMRALVKRINVGAKIEIIHKKSVKGKIVRKGTHKCLQMLLKHHNGWRCKRDLECDQFARDTIATLSLTLNGRRVTNCDRLAEGDSGLVIPDTHMKGRVGRTINGTLIVRGRCDGRIFDARSKLSHHILHTIHQYSGPGEKFWKGFDRKFLENKPTEYKHQCESNFDVVKCGEIAALICQTLIPCGRITCEKCAREFADKSSDEMKDIFARQMHRWSQQIHTKYPEFVNVHSFLQEYYSISQSVNSNYTAFGDIQKMIGHRTEAPFSHVLRVNEVLIKGNKAKPDELNAATNELREIARWLKNRTENIVLGDLRSFRNKISSKAHINAALMCDNQLDSNGNFLWRERGRHSKRFFTNFFEKVDPTNGYKKHQTRTNPNGTRKLAIGNLIISTNLEVIRERLVGVEVEDSGITKACVSKRGNNYVYPCSCVTLEDGAPLLSELITPTKRHLVVGNTGDPKFVDLPQLEDGGMYIAKEGYCYINIFLAMLVNVNEISAKNFTKTVRDTFIPQLNQWPKMLDVATACYALTVLYPETSNAELPRILIDHQSKTMHVLDSYGSATTGYHILKANTVNQLIKFASDELQSEMKHYYVGGTNKIFEMESSSLKMLVKSIYKPKLLKQLILEEPFILVLSILSPKIMSEMYNQDAFEEAIKEWITVDKSIAEVAIFLNQMARRVSTAQLLHEQRKIIDSGIDDLLSTTVSGVKLFPSYMMAIQTLQRCQARTYTNGELTKLGHFKFEDESAKLMEKIYASDLKASWDECSWLEKLSAMKRSYTPREWSIQSIRHISRNDLRDNLSSCTISSLKTIGNVTRKSITVTRNAIVDGTRSIVGKMCCKTMNLCTYFFPDIFKLINTLLVISALLQIVYVFSNIYKEMQVHKVNMANMKRRDEDAEIVAHYNKYVLKNNQKPTLHEFSTYLQERDANLWQAFKKEAIEIPVEHQAKRPNEDKLERVIGFAALMLMMFDAERSDCVYRILMKVKNLVQITDGEVRHQSLDDIADVVEEKNLTVDFDLDFEGVTAMSRTETTFETWWNHQITYNNVIPHYRTEGHFMEFTRSTCVSVANSIATGQHKDILLRGAVGSGKSTSLPFHLSKKGKVLLLEPTRPLAENVVKQMRGDPFYAKPTLRMRGLSVFGSTPIDVMTSGFALHMIGNNPQILCDYEFVIIDECHVNDSSAMAFRSLCASYDFSGKVIKVSATPPGREVEFTTQFPVQIVVEDHLSFVNFVNGLGTKCQYDACKYGVNTLIYVASYNEVDQLSKMLNDKNFRVTKVDGRTMKTGNIEIQTLGTPEKHHFVVATNIIENGVTLDIDTVVDFGLKVVPQLDLDNRIVNYNKVGISYGERIQRLGRVGRHKEGTAIRIGYTEKGLTEIPAVTAMEAAFHCFRYGLPVMTSNVSTSLLAKCTVPQARTMQQFELPVYFMVDLVKYDGTMHPAVHNLLKRYKLSESETLLNTTAIPDRCIGRWLTADQYARLGASNGMKPETKICFMVKDVPDALHEQIFEVVCKHKGDAGFGRLSFSSASKIAYTLQTDVHSIPRTIMILDKLLESEQQKRAYTEASSQHTCTVGSFSLAGIQNIIRSKYVRDHTIENISKLQAAKAQLLEFSNLNIDLNATELMQNYGALNFVHHQSENAMAEALQLKGKWNKTLIVKDIFILLGVFAGGVAMIFSHFTSKMNAPVHHQGKKSKREMQKLRFREARDNKMGREVYGDDGTMEHFFGSAYTKKGKTKGKHRGMGVKTRKFINMYGFDPTEYSLVRFVDPLTGSTLDDSPLTDINIIQEHFTEIRNDLINNDEMDIEKIRHNPGIQAFFINKAAKTALKVDLTPHNPFRVCDKTNSLAGFPEREYELRQSGTAKVVKLQEVPDVNEVSFEVVEEGASLMNGLRDFNPISTLVCQLTNDSDGHPKRLNGVGYGSYIITNRHLFARNNGTLFVKSHHGEFTVENTCSLKLLPIEGRDLLIIQMPKDFPPFPMRLQFREPIQSEMVCMVGSNFHNKHISSLVSESSTITHVQDSYFWSHWISTQDGHCGLPMVSIKDTCILGLHSLANNNNTTNYFVQFPPNFKSQYLDSPDHHKWIKGWRYNPKLVCWGALELTQDKHAPTFKLAKIISELGSEQVREQGFDDGWMFRALDGNLKAIAMTTGNLVTKHVVKGKCPLFQTYLRVNPSADAYFRPLMGAYGKSKLNKEAYIKDIMKYSTPIRIGNVDCEEFEDSICAVIDMLEKIGFQTCNYVTDTDDIFSSLNMKAAVGAMYTGKKRDYFENFTEIEKDCIIQDSCERLFNGQMGIWNGSLKAEIRPMEKIELNKTRTFTAAPIDTLLGGKVCVDDFNNQFYTLNLKGPWSVGMTKFRCGWDKLLNSFPQNWIYCDADGSQFDSSLSPYLLNAVLQIRLHFMEEWDIGERMLSNLYTEIIYTPIATPDGTIVKKFKGNNSGQPSTVVDNTLMVILAMKYSLKRLGIDYFEQDDFCKYFVNGDDLILAINPCKESVLDGLQKEFFDLGLNYNFDSRHRDIKDLWFMSHRGIDREGLLIPKLEPERIVSILEWDRASEPEHRLEAICASMIEAWGYDDLLHEIRQFYSWVLEQAPYNTLAVEGKAPYIAETALRALYTNEGATARELNEYYKRALLEMELDELFSVRHQADEMDAGQDEEQKKKRVVAPTPAGTKDEEQMPVKPRETGAGGPSRDRDVDAGTHGTLTIPRIKPISNKMRLPKIKGRQVMDLQHLIDYSPAQEDISNTRATAKQFEHWFEGVRDAYGVTDKDMDVILNGLVVWCLNNSTSPNLKGSWVMMDGDEQVEYPLQPVLEFAQPTFRMIMRHFSDIAEAYIVKENLVKPYMPRYGLQRNLRDFGLARYAFDFYEINSKTPIAAKEAHFQMKAAAVRSGNNDLFGLDGKVGTSEERTERHTAEDVNKNMHTLLGVRQN